MQTDQLDQILTPDVIAELVTFTWSAVLGIDVVPVEDVSFDAGIVSATVSIAGDDAVTIVLEHDLDAARRVAAELFGVDADVTEEDDELVRDAFGELANIIGGNVKGVLAGPEDGSVLSLPVVAHGHQSVRGSRSPIRVCFAGDGTSLVCEVHPHG